MGTYWLLQTSIRGTGTTEHFKEVLIFKHHSSEHLFNFFFFFLLAETALWISSSLGKKVISLDGSSEALAQFGVVAQLVPSRKLGGSRERWWRWIALCPGTRCVHSKLALSARLLGRAEWFLLNHCREFIVSTAACMVPWQSLAGTSWSSVHGPVYVQVFPCLAQATELQFFLTGLCLIAHR